MLKVGVAEYIPSTQFRKKIFSTHFDMPFTVDCSGGIVYLKEMGTKKKFSTTHCYLHVYVRRELLGLDDFVRILCIPVSVILLYLRDERMLHPRLHYQ